MVCGSTFYMGDLSCMDLYSHLANEGMERTVNKCRKTNRMPSNRLSLKTVELGSGHVWLAINDVIGTAKRWTKACGKFQASPASANVEAKQVMSRAITRTKRELNNKSKLKGQRCEREKELA